MSGLKTMMKSMLPMFLGLVLLGCAPPDQPLPEVDKSKRELVVQSGNQFTVKMYKHLATKQDGNLFLSPYSISTALTMAYAGAKGETAKEMANTLSFAEDRDKLHTANSWLMINLNNRGNKGHFQLSIANRLFGQKGLTFVPDFLSILEEKYLTELGDVDFKADPEKARKEVNQWVEKKTNQRIKDLMPPNSIDGGTRLVLANALYFKGTWKEKFDKSSTAPRNFFKNGTQEIQVPTMRNGEAKKVTLAETTDARIAELPYIGDSISMVIVLPKAKDGLGAIESKMTDATLKEWLAKKQNKGSVNLTLPTFKMTSKFSLKKNLEELGMKKAFDEQQADFSGITKELQLYIAAVEHKAFVEVNEEGTEAAAATGISFGATSAPITQDFHVDRPFLFLIVDKETQSVLFIGRVTDPSAAK